MFCDEFNMNIQLDPCVEVVAYRPFVHFLCSGLDEPFTTIDDINGWPFSYGAAKPYQQSCNSAYFEGDMKAVS